MKEEIKYLQYADSLILALHTYSKYLKKASAEESLIKRIEQKAVLVNTRKQEMIFRIDQIEDQEIKKIIHYRFLERLSWYDVNEMMYGYPDYQYSRKKYMRYMKKNAEG